MNLEEIRKIIELMDENHLVEFEHENEGKRVRLRKAEAPAPVVVSAASPGSAAPAPVPEGTGASGRRDGMVEFTSPLVGTFYRSPKPGEESFANVGDEIVPDKVVCIIEAMKVMNEIKAEMSGVVKEVLVKNGQAVEFGEPLFLIEKK